MEPVAVVLAMYIKTMNPLDLSGSYKKLKDTDGRAISVQYDQYKVHYRHRMWRIDPKSICQAYDGKEKEGCKIEAHNLFKEVCKSLTIDGVTGINNREKVTNMYCTSAANNKIKIATIEESKKTPLEIAKSKCNQAILKTMDSNSFESKKEKKTACEEYKRLKNK